VSIYTPGIIWNDNVFDIYIIYKAKNCWIHRAYYFRYK